MASNNFRVLVSALWWTENNFEKLFSNKINLVPESFRVNTRQKFSPFFIFLQYDKNTKKNLATCFQQVLQGTKYEWGKLMSNTKTNDVTVADETK